MQLAQPIQQGMVRSRGKLLSIDTIKGPQAERRGTIEFGFAATRLGNEFFPLKLSVSDTSGARKQVFRIIRQPAGRAANWRAIGRGEIRLRRRRINSMRLREFSTPKSVSKETNDIEAETIKRQQQKLAGQQLTKQR